MNIIKKKSYGVKEIYLMGDVHLPRGKAGLFKDTIDEIRRNQEAKVILMGDYVENISANDPRYDPEEMASIISKYGYPMNMINEQWDWFENIITPVKDKIWGAIAGNHEYEYLRRHSINPLKSICKRLDIDYLGNGVSLFIINGGDNACRILVQHGQGGSSITAGYVYTKTERYSKQANAVDVIAAGHTHRLGVDVSVQPLDVDEETGELCHKNQYLVATGAFLGNYEDSNGDAVASYSERKAYPPLPIGYVKVVIEDGKVSNVYPVPL